MTTCYTNDELLDLGLASVGSNVRIDRSVRFFGAPRISIGDNVRIDAYCVISAGEQGIHIGSHIHISVFCSLLGAGKIVLEDFSTISVRVSIFSSNDDYSGNSLTNPCIPDKFRNVTSGPVVIQKHAIIGAGAVILPNVTLGIGSAVGALSLVRKNVPAYTVVAGSPAKKISTRANQLEALEKAFLAYKSP